MILCRITGDVVSTVKSAKLSGQRLLLTQPVELDGRTPVGGSFISLDVVQAGVSDLVLAIREGSGARLIFKDEQIPVEAVIVAVVDDYEVEDARGLEGTSALELARGLARTESEA